jgi:GT2 family glycosyltransferase
MPNLAEVSILLKTFLRDEKLFDSVAAIRRSTPEIQMIIVDDGEQSEEKDGIYADLIREGHTVIILPFDSGFGAKSNAGIQALVRPMLLISSDDFNHNPPSFKVGIEKMLAVLDRSPIPHIKFDIVSGRLANRGPYEFDLIEKDGIVTERDCKFDKLKPIISAVQCDVTVNYSLIRREVFDKVKFDNEEIIGEGGHGAFFYDVKKAGFKVAYVPGVEISEQTSRDSDRYRQFRARAHGPSRRCFEKRGIKKWVLGNGQIDYDVTGEQK